MRLIDADSLIGEITKAQDSLVTDNDDLFERNKGYFKGLAWARMLVLDANTIDAVPVVRCRECKRWSPRYDDRTYGSCERLLNKHWADNDYTEQDHFCSYGELKEGEDNG